MAMVGCSLKVNPTFATYLQNLKDSKSILLPTIPMNTLSSMGTICSATGHASAVLAATSGPSILGGVCWSEHHHAGLLERGWGEYDTHC